jgi:hypothetical protein
MKLYLWGVDYATEQVISKKGNHLLLGVMMVLPVMAKV